MARTSSLASRHTSALRLALGAASAVLLAASTAHAQDPAQPQLPAVVVAPAAPAGRAVTVVSTGADGASTIIVVLGDHSGIDGADAETIRELVAHDLASHHAGSGNYEVRMGKLGSRVLLVLEHRTQAGIDERHTLISGVEEAPTASQRVVDALVSGRPLEETQNVTNVLSQEARTPLQKQGRPGFAGGIIGVTPAGIASGVGAGAELGMVYESDRFALSLHGRLAGGGSGSDTSFTYFNLGVGARYFLSDGDFSPYVGGGTGFSAYQASTSGNSWGGTGLNLYGELGIEGFRTHRVSMIAGLRADAPLFALADGSDKKYAVPVSLNVGMVFK
jgi:opacity protein-like surface antigen